MIKIYNNVNPTKLVDELINNGIVPILVTNDRAEGEIVANNTKIKFTEGTDMDIVNKIVTAHDITPLPEALSEIDKLKISQAEQFETILELLGGM